MSQIPPQVDEIFQELKSEITWLYGRWIIYRQLFGHSERRIDLLNECAATFFYFIQDVLLGEVQVTLSKLTDPARSGNNDNLSLEQLQSRIEAWGEPQLAVTLRALLNDIYDKCQSFRLHRNKRLAHLDLTTAMQSISNPLPGVSRQMITDALGLICQYMNVIQTHYTQNETAYEHFIMHSDGNSLVAMLKHGLRYEELLENQTIPWDDWRQAKWQDA